MGEHRGLWLCWPGHNAEIITDDEGTYWVLYPPYISGEAGYSGLGDSFSFEVVIDDIRMAL